MTKTIRPTYHKDISAGMLIIIFAIVFFLAGQLFESNQSDVEWFRSVYAGEFLVSCAVMIVILIMWEEILFPVKIKPVEGGLIFRNHRKKLKIQAIIYLTIPVIIAFIYLTFEVNMFRFVIWASVCLILPVIGKLVSGINNFNDFLQLTISGIEFKDNEHEGNISLDDIKQITLVRDEHEELHQLRLDLKNGDPVVIEVHQMELEAFFDSIEQYLKDTYSSILKEETLPKE